MPKHIKVYVSFGLFGPLYMYISAYNTDTLINMYRYVQILGPQSLFLYCNLFRAAQKHYYIELDFELLGFVLLYVFYIVNECHFWVANEKKSNIYQ